MKLPRTRRAGTVFAATDGTACGAPVHIVYVTETYPPELNGVALTVARAIQWLRRHGHSVELIRPRQRQERRACAEGGDSGDRQYLTRGLRLPMYADLQFGLPAGAVLRRRWSERRPDLVHVCTEGPLGASAVWTARALNIPVTSEFRTNFHSYSRYYGLGWAEPVVAAYLRAFHNRTDMTFVPTRAVQRALADAEFERLRVIGRGVDTEQFSPQRRCAELRAQWGAAPDTPVVIYVGRLAAEKNVDLVVRAFRALQMRVPETRLLWVGDGPQRARLQQAVPDAIFAGVQRAECLARWYASADIFLFPSLTDTFGNVTLEALASGLVVVAFDAGAAGAHIRSGTSGMLATPGSEQEFIALACAAVLQLAQLSPLRADARAAALAASWDAVLDNFELQLTHVAYSSQDRAQRTYRLA